MKPFAIVTFGDTIRVFTKEEYRKFLAGAVVNNLDVVTFNSYRVDTLTEEQCRTILAHHPEALRAFYTRKIVHDDIAEAFFCVYAMFIADIFGLISLWRNKK